MFKSNFCLNRGEVDIDRENQGSGCPLGLAIVEEWRNPMHVFAELTSSESNLFVVRIFVLLVYAQDPLVSFKEWDGSCIDHIEVETDKDLALKFNKLLL